MNFCKNFLILLILSALAYHANTNAQGSPSDVNANALFITEDATSNTSYLNKVDMGRSSVFSMKFLNTKIKPESIHWTNALNSKILTFSALEGNSLKLYAIQINLSRPVTTKTIQLPENIQNELKISTWIARTATSFVAISNENKTLYNIVLTLGSTPKVSVIYKTTNVNAKSFANFSMDYSGKNLFFSYTDGDTTSLPFEKVFYIYNLEKQKILPLDANNLCRGNIVLINNQPQKLSSDQFVLYCSPSAAHKQSFINIDLKKFSIKSFDTNLTITDTSNMAIDASGFFVNIKTSAERTVYCNGNVKEVQSLRCSNITLFPNGQVVATSNGLAQFYIINSRTIYGLDFSTGLTRRTSVVFTAPLTSDIIGPVSF